MKQHLIKIARLESRAICMRLFSYDYLFVGIEIYSSQNRYLSVNRRVSLTHFDKVFIHRRLRAR